MRKLADRHSSSRCFDIFVAPDMSVNYIALSFDFIFKPARDFCEKLMDISISFKGEPKKEIANSAWFYGRFEKDPTVKAMLIMLDTVHSYYEQELAKNNSIKLFPALSKLSFYILPLGGFNL